ncbi:MAG: citrate (Si)-synthase [candidate division Zixibacteria bacterium]|nr:citrate (Si)-synthase [candidate division Zixibacteria bacterium]
MNTFTSTKTATDTTPRAEIYKETGMAITLKEKLAGMIPKLRQEREELLRSHGEKTISSVTISQAIGGTRGVRALVCDTSVVEADQGLIIRGIPIMELIDRLPEEIFWLLLTGELPSGDELKLFQKELRAQGEVPAYIWKLLQCMPKNSHPMTMLSSAILAMSNESAFRKKYDEGIPKSTYWEPALEDAIKIMGTVHTIAAGIYRMRYKKGPVILPSTKTDWSSEYVRMLGLAPKKGETSKMMQLYLVLHSDHEGGNVSAYSCHTVGSALSDPFYSVSAGLNGLAGPLHGLANQECLGWILDTIENFGCAPTEEQIREYSWKTLKSGQVIPGYGHAVLRITDPRFTAITDFGRKHLKHDPVFQTVDRVFNVVPNVLLEQGKAKDPWPNVDAGSGAVLYHYGLKEFEYYTVVFSVSRVMGMLAQLVLNRALGTPITRPKSVSTAWLRQEAMKEKN